MVYDTIIRRGTIVDGTGGPPFEGDVAIKDGKIAAIGQIPATGDSEIDASGCVVAPGFIDASWRLPMKPLQKVHIECSNP